MIKLLGITIVVTGLLVQFIPSHQSVMILVQPLEWVIIFSLALGALMVQTPGTLLIKSFRRFFSQFLGAPISKRVYFQTAEIIAEVSRLLTREGELALEKSLENPKNSPLFRSRPQFSKNKDLSFFFVDNVKMLVWSDFSAAELEVFIQEEINATYKEEKLIADSFQRVGDAMPAFGIIAAILGIVQTMSLLDQDIMVIGGHLAAALIGTLTGVLLAYAFFLPLSHSMLTRAQQQRDLYSAIMKAIVAMKAGYSTSTCLEVLTKTFPSHAKVSYDQIRQGF